MIDLLNLEASWWVLAQLIKSIYSTSNGFVWSDRRVVLIQCDVFEPVVQFAIKPVFNAFSVQVYFLGETSIPFESTL